MLFPLSGTLFPELPRFTGIVRMVRMDHSRWSAVGGRLPPRQWFLSECAGTAVGVGVGLSRRGWGCQLLLLG